MNANRIALLSALALSANLHAQQSLDSMYRTAGQAVTAAFEPERAVLQSSSAVIKDGRAESAYGVVISPDGYILTKASEVRNLKRPAVTVDRTVYDSVKIPVVDPKWDVALLKVDAEGLLPVVYASTSDVPQGTWVVVNGVTSRSNRRALAGIVSARTREIPASGGAALGVVLNPDSKSLEIAEVNEKSGAKDAGLQKGDVIVAIDEKSVKELEDVAEILKDRKAGATAKVTVRRGRETITLDVRLAAKGELFDEQMTRNDQMSGSFSKRRSGFPRVLQHDVMGNSTVMGGPVLDLDGHCLGMNIARANRAETFAIPVEDLKEIAQRLMKTARAAEKEPPASATP